MATTAVLAPGPKALRVQKQTAEQQLMDLGMYILLGLRRKSSGFLLAAKMCGVPNGEINKLDIVMRN